MDNDYNDEGEFQEIGMHGRVREWSRVKIPRKRRTNGKANEREEHRRNINRTRNNANIHTYNIETELRTQVFHN